MKIGIIGAGAIGGTLARKFAAVGHEVKLAAAKGPEAIRALANGIGAAAVTREEAVSGVDAIVISVPTLSLPDLAGLLRGAPEVPIIDTSNYYPFRDGRIAELDDGKPESIWVAEQIGRPVTKAFNATLAHTLSAKGQPKGTPSRIAIPVAGDDPHGKRIAFELVDAAGFEPVDAGDLADSWRQQPGTPAYCTELTSDQMRLALAAADKARAAEHREALIKEVFEAGTAVTHDHIIARNRIVTAP